MDTTSSIPQHHNALSRALFSRPMQPVPEEREYNPQDRRPWKRILWSWVDPMLRRGFDRVIVPKDIPYVPKKDAMKIRFAEYKKYLRKHVPTPHTKYIELWALLYAIRYRLLTSLACRFVVCGCQIGMSLLQRKLIEEAEELSVLHGHRSHGKVSGYTIGTIALDTILLMCDMLQMYLSIMNSEYARTLMMSCIHDKMLRLGPQQRHDYSAAKIMTISSSDCRRACMVFMQVNSLFILPFYFGATIGILIYMIGVAGLPGVGILLIGLGISTVASFYAATLRQLSMPYQDRRVSLTRETLKNINIIKFYGWEEPFLKIIRGLRAMETRYIRLLELVDAFNVATLFAAPNLAGALSFAVKIIISSGLPASRAFPSLTLFQIYMPILSEVSVALTNMSDTVVGARRLDKFFRLPEVPSYLETFERTEKNAGITAVIENASFSWVIAPEAQHSDDHSSSDEKQSTASIDECTEKKVLNDMNIVLNRGSMILVIGSVGTGKTSLLSAFVNAIPKSSGSVRIANDVTTSSVLSLWSQSQSVRENILFGLEFDQKKYDSVVHICDLQSDFDLFARGDHTEVGENGVSLSGGQRARLALARCLYADGDLIILDDVLSAMDSRVGNHVYRELIALAHNQNKTVLFSTNNLKFVNDADWVLSLDNFGNVTQQRAQDSPHFQHKSNTPLPELTEKQEKAAREHEAEYDVEHAEEQHELEKHLHEARDVQVHEPAVHKPILAAAGNVEGVPVVPSIRQPDDEEVVNALHPEVGAVALSNGSDLEKQDSNHAELGGEIDEMDEERRATGSVTVGILVRYFALNRPLGFFLGVTILLSAMCFATSQAMTNVLLNWWTGNKFDKSQGFNLGMYTLVASLVAVFYAIFANVMSYSATESSTTLHNAALTGLYRAPMSFFQKNPLGRLMMRFTQDMVNLDTQLLVFARIAFMQLLTLLASIIVVFVYLPWVIICLAPIICIAFVLMSFYRTTSREINRCMQLFDSRGMASLSEHIDGQEVIVAFGKAEQSQNRIHDRLDDVISATLYNEASNFWMALRGGLMCEIVNLVAIFLAVFQVFNLRPEQVGTVISILPEVRNSLTLFFPMYALFDNQLNSVERLDEYATGVAIEGSEVTANAELSSWVPPRGEIEFKNVSLRYRPGLPLVLNNFNVKIGGGKKIGICGRTGAGKSTLISALFRLVEVSSGIVTVDGQDISELPLKTLRQALSIIPQSPVLFQGTIRSNLDPFSEKTDEEVASALRQAGLNSSEFSLATEVEAEGTNFSLGQRQMLALARVILRNSKILVLDEATAAVDHKTDEEIQRTLKSVFKGFTVLCIAHRLETIMDYDEILVMGPGGVKLEMGPPQLLWNDQNSVFRAMCDEADVHF